MLNRLKRGLEDSDYYTISLLLVQIDILFKVICSQISCSTMQNLTTMEMTWNQDFFIFYKLSYKHSSHVIDFSPLSNVKKKLTLTLTIFSDLLLLSKNGDSFDDIA